MNMSLSFRSNKLATSQSSQSVSTSSSYVTRKTPPSSHHGKRVLPSMTSIVILLCYFIIPIFIQVKVLKPMFGLDKKIESSTDLLEKIRSLVKESTNLLNLRGKWGNDLMRSVRKELSVHSSIRSVTDKLLLTCFWDERYEQVVKHRLRPHKTFDFLKESEYWKECSLDCDYTWDQRLLSDADAIVFFYQLRDPRHRKNQEKLLPPRTSRQKRVIINIESAIEFARNTEGLELKDYDLDFMAYFTREARVWISYFRAYENFTVDDLFHPVPTKHNWWNTQREGEREGEEGQVQVHRPRKTQEAGWNITSPLLFLTSNCSPRQRRKSLVEEMMQHIEIDSYGQCLNNKQFPEVLVSLGHTQSHGWNVKRELLQRYKFILTFENRAVRDYVTEKFYQPFAHGSLGVYYGAPTVSYFELFPHSYINVDDFRNTTELVEYIKLIDRNEKLYSGYFEWKKFKKDLKKKPNWHLKHDLYSSPCRLCKALSESRIQDLLSNLNKTTIPSSSSSSP